MQLNIKVNTFRGRLLSDAHILDLHDKQNVVKKGNHIV